jgi:hypothetical protein
LAREVHVEVNEVAVNEMDEVLVRDVDILVVPVEGVDWEDCL